MEKKKRCEDEKSYLIKQIADFEEKFQTFGGSILKL